MSEQGSQNPETYIAPKPPTVLLPSWMDEVMVEKIHEISPGAQILKSADIKEHPELIENIEVAVGSLKPEYWERAKNLKWFQATAAGVERFLDNGGREHPAIITNVHIHADPMAEHFFGTMLMLTRNLHTAHQQQLDENVRWNRQAVSSESQTLKGKTLGIVGLGAIGNRIAELGQAFNMNIVGLRRSGKQDEPFPVYGPSDKHEMLAQCDYVVVVLPSTQETQKFIGEDELRAMKSSAYIFNLGRGNSIDTEALVRALEAGQIKGAGLDATDPEPLPADHPLWEMTNVLITPHSSGDFPEYQQDVDKVFLDNFGRYIRGEKLANVIDKKRGY